MTGFVEVLTLALIVVGTVDWIAVAVMWRAHRRSIAEHGRSPRTLDERGQLATLIAVAVTIGIGLGINRLANGPLPTEANLIVLALILVLPSVGNVLWLVRTLRGDFNGKP